MFMRSIGTTCLHTGNLESSPNEDPRKGPEQAPWMMHDDDLYGDSPFDLGGRKKKIIEVENAAV
jgi:hypothetical protein